MRSALSSSDSSLLTPGRVPSSTAGLLHPATQGLPSDAELTVDDLTGDPADTTVKFSLDKTAYEIDLSNDNAAELRQTFSR